MIWKMPPFSLQFSSLSFQVRSRSSTPRRRPFRKGGRKIILRTFLNGWICATKKGWKKDPKYEKKQNTLENSCVLCWFLDVSRVCVLFGFLSGFLAGQGFSDPAVFERTWDSHQKVHGVWWCWEIDETWTCIIWHEVKFGKIHLFLGRQTWKLLILHTLRWIVTWLNAAQRIGEMIGCFSLTTWSMIQYLLSAT